MIELFRRSAGDRDVVVACTERSDGDVHPLQVPSPVLRERQLAATGRCWAMLDQVHGAARVDQSSAEPDVDAPVIGVGDVLVADAGRPIAIWAADCAPLVLVDSQGAIVGCHAGWRGLAGGAIDVAVAACQPGRPLLGAVLGPCMHPCCYEFGASDLERVAAGVGVEPTRIASTTAWGTPALDVPAAVEYALHRHGIELSVAGPCTGCDERWFSHRRGDLGRHGVVAWNEPTP